MFTFTKESKYKLTGQTKKCEYAPLPPQKIVYKHRMKKNSLFDMETSTDPRPTSHDILFIVFVPIIWNQSVAIHNTSSQNGQYFFGSKMRRKELHSGNFWTEFKGFYFALKKKEEGRKDWEPGY